MDAENPLELDSPISLKGEPINCVEATIYDNDGPEGFFKRMRFPRSREVILYLAEVIKANPHEELNFEVTNYWKQSS